MQCFTVSGGVFLSIWLRSPTVVVTGLSTKMVWNQSLASSIQCRNVTWHGGCWKSGSHHGVGSGRSLLIQYFTCCRYELRAAKRCSWQRTDAIVQGKPGRFKCFSSSVFWVWSTGESINMVGGGATVSIVGEIDQRENAGYTWLDVKKMDFNFWEFNYFSQMKKINGMCLLKIDYLASSILIQLLDVFWSSSSSSSDESS